MNQKPTIFGLPLSQAIGLFSFLVVLLSTWVHMEIRIAELNIEIVNLKQDFTMHKSDNRREMEIMHSEINTDMKEILRKVDEIQIYLRKKNN
jgi:hypothetical protein